MSYALKKRDATLQDAKEKLHDLCLNPRDYVDTHRELAYAVFYLIYGIAPDTFIWENVFLTWCRKECLSKDPKMPLQVNPLYVERVPLEAFGWRLRELARNSGFGR